MRNKIDMIKGIVTGLNKDLLPSDDPAVFLASSRPDLLDFGVIPTGNIAIDNAIGGGFPRGVPSQLIGQEGTGKTKLLFDCIAHNQKIDAEFTALYVHTEASVFPLKSALESGIILDRLLIVNPFKSGEQTFEIALKFIWDIKERKPIKVSKDRPLVDLMIIDSITSAQPEADVTYITENGMSGVGQPARLAAMTSKFFRYVCGTGALGRTALVIVNQTRVSLGEYNAPKKGTGGEACKYYPKITIQVSKVLDKKEQREKAVTGHKVNFQVTKNNTGRAFPYTSGEYTVIYGVGVDPTEPLIDLAIKRGIILDLGLQKFLIPTINKLDGSVIMPKVDMSKKPVTGDIVRASEGKAGRVILKEFINNNEWLVNIIKSDLTSEIETTTIETTPNKDYEFSLLEEESNNEVENVL